MLSIHPEQLFRKSTENGLILWPIPPLPDSVFRMSLPVPPVPKHLLCRNLSDPFVLLWMPLVPTRPGAASSICPLLCSYFIELCSSVFILFTLLSKLKKFFSVFWKQLLPLGHSSCPFSPLCLYYSFPEVCRLWIHTSQRQSAFMELQDAAEQGPDDFWEVPPTTPKSLPMGVSAWDEFNVDTVCIPFVSPKIYLSGNPSAISVPTTGLCWLSQLFEN